jgi:large subunit ribosomal protein L21e
MAQRTGTARRKTRRKLKKPAKLKGKFAIRKFMQRFNSGDKVVLCADPVYQKGMYWRRFHGMIGVVDGHKGRSYEVVISDGGKRKTLIVNPVHLKRV